MTATARPEQRDLKGELFIDLDGALPDFESYQPSGEAVGAVGDAWNDLPMLRQVAATVRRRPETMTDFILPPNSLYVGVQGPLVLVILDDAYVITGYFPFLNVGIDEHYIRGG